MEVPFVNLKAQLAEIQDEVCSAIKAVVASCDFIHGKAVDDFEISFAKYIGAKYCLGLNSGTDALFIALKTLNAENSLVYARNDTFVAAKEAIILAGGSYTSCLHKDIDTAIITHLHGIPSVSEFKHLRAYIPFIEDCAQAHGAEYLGQKVGTFGAMGCFSFYPGKNLGAYGDAGAIVTDNRKYYDYARMFANHGRKLKYEHKFSGVNSRMDSIQAAVLNVKLKHLDRWNDRRREVAKRYTEELGLLVKCPVEPEGCKSVYHLYVIETDQRSRLIPYLKNAGIQTGVHYPYLLSGEQNKEIMSLPICGSITDEAVDYVISKVKGFFNG